MHSILARISYFEAKVEATVAILNKNDELLARDIKDLKEIVVEHKAEIATTKQLIAN